MDSAFWLRHFEHNRRHRPEPQWHQACDEDPATAMALSRSLSHFQLGESGEGTFLLAEARRSFPDDPDYVDALALFVGEEQEHARLLERLVARFGGTLVTRHWTHRCFRLLRRALGVELEIQTLVIAELIGLAYYRLLRAGTGDGVLVQVCELMVRDEVHHLDFHAQRMAARQAHWLPAERALWAVQFQLLFLVAVQAAWVDHRRALTAIGAGRRRFFRQARLEGAAFLMTLQAVPSPSSPAGM